MSDVNLVFTVNSVSSTFTVDTTTVNVTPNTTAINMFAGYAAYPPSGSAGNSQVLFNDAGVFGGTSNFTYNKLQSRLTVPNITVLGQSNLGSVTDLRISGGTTGQYLTSNGAGGVQFSTLTPGGNSGEIQFNSTGTFQGVPNVTFSDGNLSLGNTSNVKLLGGTNGYVLQTDGTGNLTWTAQSGGTPGNGSPGGSNTQVQYNNAGVFGGDAGFTYDDITDTLTVSNTFTTITKASQPNITSVGNLSSLNVSGVLTVTNSTVIQQGREKATVVSAPSTTYNFDFLNQAIVYFTGSTNNFTLNFRGNSSTTFNSVTSDGESMTLVVMVSQGASTIYMPTTIQIDGVTISPKWIGGYAPVGSALQQSMLNGILSFGFTIIKTSANTYTVLASFTGYK